MVIIFHGLIFTCVLGAKASPPGIYTLGKAVLCFHFAYYVKVMELISIALSDSLTIIVQPSMACTKTDLL